MPEEIPGAGAAPAAAATEDNKPDNGGSAPAENPGQAKPADGADPKPNEGADKGTDEAEDDDGLGDEFADDNADPAENKRKTAKDYIIQRKNAKIAKLKKQQQEGAKPEGDKPEDDEPGEQADDEGAEPDGEGDDAPPYLEGLRPIVEKHIATEDAKEVEAFLKDHPDLEPYKAKVERWMKHPSRRHLPVSSIFFEVAGEHLMRIGATRARKADQKAKETQMGGGPNREATQPIDWSKATPEQLEAEQMRVRQGRS